MKQFFKKTLILSAAISIPSACFASHQSDRNEMHTNATDATANDAHNSPRKQLRQESKNIVAYLADPKLKGRVPLTKEHGQTIEYLVKWFEKNGFKGYGNNAEVSYLQSVPYKKSFGHNIIAGFNEKKGEVFKPKMIFSAHFDHLGKHLYCSSIQEKDHCLGAADNAAGVAAVLAAAKELSKSTTEPYAVILYDLEEYGLLGSDHFVENPTFPLEQVALMINLDTVGLDLFKSLSMHTLVMGSESGGQKLTDLVTQQGKATNLVVHNFSYALSDDRTDLSSFVHHDKNIPFLQIGDGDGSVYHTTEDNLQNLNYEKVALIADYIVGLGQKVLNDHLTFSYTAPSEIFDQYIPTKTDLASLVGILGDLITHATENNFDKTQLETLRESLKTAKGIQARDPDLLLPNSLYEIGDIASTITGMSAAHFLHQI